MFYQYLQGTSTINQYHRMNSVLRYVASGSKGTGKSLAQEIASLTGTHPKLIPSLDSVEFSANQKQLLDICYKSHLIQNLKVQVGKKFQALDEKQLMLGLRKLPLHAFIQQRDREIGYKIVSQDSKLGLSSLDFVIKKYLSENSLNGQKNVGAMSSQPYKPVNNLEGIVAVEHAALELLVSDRFARLYTPVNRTPMYKHGWKTNVNYAPLRESLAAAMLYDSGIMGKAKRAGTLKLWDPFCGSGTFLLEALSLYSNVSVRSNHSWLQCSEWPCFDKQLFNRYKEQLVKDVQVRGNISLIGSDIDVNTINSTLDNYRHLGVSLAGNKQKSPLIKRSPHHKVFTSAQNELYFIAEDFETVGKQMLLEEGMSIITNLPFGHRSREKTNKNQLLSIYKRFDRFLAANKSRFDQVLVLLPTASILGESHFLSITDQKWEIKNCYSSGGKEVGLYSLVSNTNIVVPNTQFQPMDIQQSLDNQSDIALSVIERANKNMKINTKLPSHLIPRTPKRGRQRVEHRRKVHQMREDYKQHALQRGERQEMKQFESEKKKERRAKRGEVWREENQKMLGEKIENPRIRNRISGVFQDKIQDAISVGEKEKERREKKKALNKGKVVPVRKW